MNYFQMPMKSNAQVGLTGLINYVIEYFGGLQQPVPIADVHNMLKTLAARRNIELPTLENFELMLTKMDSRYRISKGASTDEGSFVQLKEPPRPRTCNCGKCITAETENRPSQGDISQSSKSAQGFSSFVEGYESSGTSLAHSLNTKHIRRCIKRSFRPKPYDATVCKRCSSHRIHQPSELMVDQSDSGEGSIIRNVENVPERYMAFGTPEVE